MIPIAMLSPCVRASTSFFVVLGDKRSITCGFFHIRSMVANAAMSKNVSHGHRYPFCAIRMYRPAIAGVRNPMTKGVASPARKKKIRFFIRVCFLLGDQKRRNLLWLPNKICQKTINNIIA